VNIARVELGYAFVSDISCLAIRRSLVGEILVVQSNLIIYNSPIFPADSIDVCISSEER
jgi:hypothetical protein